MRTIRCLELSLIAALIAAPLAASAKTPAPPAAAKKVPVKDIHHGTEIVDEYRWLENNDDPEVQQWTKSETTYARAILDKLPGADAIRKRLREIITARPPEHFDLQPRKTGVFALKFAPPKQQPYLVLLASPDDKASEKTLVDPNELDPTHKTAIDFYVPSLDGKKVAVSMSQKGTEDGTVQIWDVESKTKLGDFVPRVNGGTAGGSLAWNADGSGFFYTRYPRPGERPAEDLPFYQQVYFHRLGTPTEQDTYSIGKDFPRIAENFMDTSEDGKYVLLKSLNGDGGEYAFYVHDGQKWTQISKYADEVVGAKFGDKGKIYLLSRKAAPRGKILEVAAAAPELAKARLVVAESEATIQGFVPTATRIYVIDQLGGPSQLRVMGYDGKELGKVPLLPVSSVGQVVRSNGDSILFRNTSYLEPAWWYRFSPEDPAPKKTALGRTAVVDFSDTEVVREFATSKDGTKIPLNILRKKGIKLDGSHPTILYGYGGYSVSQTPRFVEDLRVWIEQGGVYAIANLRGGGEFGEEWHRQGYLTKKQNVFDDFYAAAQHLISAGYTKPEKLAAEGGSNGGLLMGAMITQHPETFRAIASFVGIYDMVRVETTNNGEFNTTEFGTVRNKEQFEALYAYSPYHRVADGTNYPAIFFSLGANDPRVDPWHTRKFVARLRAAAPKRTIVMRVSEFGHGVGSSMDDRIAMRGDALVFLMNELGVKYSTPKKKTR